MELSAIAVLEGDQTGQELLEEALEQSQARFRALLVSLHDPTIAIDAHGTIQIASIPRSRRPSWSAVPSS